MSLPKGTKVIYGASGVCTISDYREEDFGTGRKLYCVLTPSGEKSSADIFVPADNETLMNKIKVILSPEEINALIDRIPEENMDWIDDSRERGAAFEKIISCGDRLKIAVLIKSIYLRKKECASEGKKIGIADERVMRSAERLLFEEFAAVLGIEPDDVRGFIMRRLECPAK